MISRRRSGNGGGGDRSLGKGRPEARHARCPPVPSFLCRRDRARRLFCNWGSASPNLSGSVMETQMFSPRKQRTRQHVIADQSVNHVERLIIDAGHTAQRLTADYGYDLVLFTYDD